MFVYAQRDIGESIDEQDVRMPRLQGCKRAAFGDFLLRQQIFAPTKSAFMPSMAIKVTRCSRVATSETLLLL